jgi:hypothetical protein
VALVGLGFKASRGWGSGVYEGPSLTHTRLVVVAELPRTRDTLLLRLMGAGRVLRRAIADLRALADDALERAIALPVLLSLRLEIPAEPDKRTRDEEEFVMSTQDMVEAFIEQQRSKGRNEGRREGRNEGRREGRDEGLAEGLIEVFTARFGAPPAKIAALVKRTHDRTLLREWLKLAATGPAAEVVAAIRERAPR